MITQEKQEHKNAILSSTTQPSNGAKSINEDCPLLGQPARNAKSDGARIGWDNDTLAALDRSTELQYLQDKVTALTHQVEVHRLTEITRSEDAEAYRLKLVAEHLKEQEEFANSEPTPLLLTRGVQNEVLNPLPPQRTRLDWYSFTADEPVDILKQYCDIIFPGCIFQTSKHGTQGYKSFTTITYNGEYQGQINYSGTTSRNQFLLTGNGCEKIRDWMLAYQWLKLLKEPKITLIHICLDDYEGKYVNLDIFEQGYIDGKFQSTKSRKNPSRSIHEDFFGDGYSKGRTTNIGKTKGYTRCCTGYEKGKEQFLSLFAKLPAYTQRDLIDKMKLEDLSIDFPSGVTLSTSILKWYRVEVKLSSSDVLIPLEAILETDKYFAGAYPFTNDILSQVTPGIEGATPQRLPTSTERFVEEIFLNCGNSYGSSIYTTLLMANARGDNLQDYCVEIVKKIIDGHCRPNQKLIKTGGLGELKPFDPKELIVPKKDDLPKAES